MVSQTSFVMVVIDHQHRTLEVERVMGRDGPRYKAKGARDPPPGPKKKFFSK